MQEDDEMGVGGAVAEDAEAEYIRKICEHEILTGILTIFIIKVWVTFASKYDIYLLRNKSFSILGNNLLSIFAPVAVMVCSNPTKYKSVELQSAASLALSKFMLVR